MEWWEASLRGRESPERVQGHRVGADFLETLSVTPAHGRGFLAEEARAGQDEKVVLGHALWQRAFGGEPMLGRSVIVDAEPHLVVGIAPPGFQFPDGTEVRGRPTRAGAWVCRASARASATRYCRRSCQ
jgi:hypothetical protein